MTDKRISELTQITGAAFYGLIALNNFRIAKKLEDK